MLERVLIVFNCCHPSMGSLQLPRQRCGTYSFFGELVSVVTQKERIDAAEGRVVAGHGG